MSTKRLQKSKARKQLVLYLGVFFVVVGVFLIVSSITIVEFQSMKLTYTGPFGQINIDSLTPEQEQKIFVGFIVASLGIALIKIGI